MCRCRVVFLRNDVGEDGSVGPARQSSADGALPGGAGLVGYQDPNYLPGEVLQMVQATAAIECRSLTAAQIREVAHADPGAGTHVVGGAAGGDAGHRGAVAAHQSTQARPSTRRRRRRPDGPPRRAVVAQVPACSRFRRSRAGQRPRRLGVSSRASGIAFRGGPGR